MNRTFRRLAASLSSVGALALVLATPAHAAFTVPPEVAQAGVDAATLALAVLGVLIGIRAFKWIRGAM